MVQKMSSRREVLHRHDGGSGHRDMLVDNKRAQSRKSICGPRNRHLASQLPRRLLRLKQKQGTTTHTQPRCSKLAQCTTQPPTRARSSKAMHLVLGQHKQGPPLYSRPRVIHPKHSQSGTNENTQNITSSGNSVVMTYWSCFGRAWGPHLRPHPWVACAGNGSW